MKEKKWQRGKQNNKEGKWKYVKESKEGKRKEGRGGWQRGKGRGTKKGIRIRKERRKVFTGKGN